ncbi:ABC transporter substrate-binding protein [Seminibacterium arietis]|uniref:ABC transporter substrate-binding protein n=1 Tax=Seminibacterium arietis TaxID=1173502 RepID=A0ABW3I9W0_9PAST
MKKTFLTLATSLLALLAVSSVSAVDITVENAAGKQLVPQNPQRVVVLDFSAVDSVRALGEKNKIVGLAKSVNIPDYLSEFKSENYVNLGSLKEPDFEKINDLNPDLIIATTRQKKVINRLKEIAPVFYMHTDYTKLYESFQQNVNALGQIFSKQDIAKEKLANLEQRMKSLAEKTKGKTALVTLVNESKVSVYGDVSRYAVVYNNFGFTPADNAIKSSFYSRHECWIRIYSGKKS